MVQKPNWLLRFIDPKNGMLDGHAMQTLTQIANQANTNATNITALQALPVSPFSKSFTSSQQTYSNNSSVTVAHGLGAVPALVQITMICITANLSYLVGEIISADLETNTFRIDNTNIQVSINNGGIFAVPKGGGATTAVTAADWQLIIKAWV